MYEQDITPLWEQHIEVKDRVREAIYPLLYGREYKFSVTTGRNSADGGRANGYDEPGTIPSVGNSTQVKPFIPVSTEEDLMRVLGPPMH